MTQELAFPLFAPPDPLAAAKERLRGAVRKALDRAGILFASFSDYAENKILDHVLSDGAFTEPTNVYLGLWTSALTDASTSATAGEAAYTGYARVEILATDLSAAASGSKTNSAALTFPAVTAGTATITYFGVFDVASGAGNCLMWGTVTSKVVDTANTPPTIAIGALVVTLD